jgi:hypothetical protein
MKLYHVTSAASAAAIRSTGFRDLTHDFIGVWFSDRPLWDGGYADPDCLPDGWACLTVDVPDAVAAPYLLERDAPYREWRIPAAVANQYRLRTPGAD